MATSGSVQRMASTDFRPETGQYIRFYHDPNDPRTLTDNFIYSLSISTDNILWVGSKKGLNRLNLSEQKNSFHFVRHSISPIKSPHPDYLAHNHIYALHQDTTTPECLWVGTSAGLKK